jgi:hypothetical protein
VSILGLDKPLSIGAIDAKIVDSRHIAIDTQNVSAFELDLRHPSLATGGRILILADGLNLTADAGSAHARFELRAGGSFARAKPGLPEALSNAGSGQAALFDGPLVIVYGSLKGSRTAENRAVAEALAVWDAGSIGTRGRFPVLRDSELTPEIEAASSLLLVGWPEDNAVLARLAARLPLQPRGGRVPVPATAAGEGAGATGAGSKPAKGPSGSGLLLVCPNPEMPGRLLGVAALPMRGKAAAVYARSLIAPLTGYSFQTELSGYASPDVLILDARGQSIWTGAFDWKWEKLEPLDG